MIIVTSIDMHGIAPIEGIVISRSYDCTYALMNVIGKALSGRSLSNEIGTKVVGCGGQILYSGANWSYGVEYEVRN